MRRVEIYEITAGIAKIKEELLQESNTTSGSLNIMKQAKIIEPLCNNLNDALHIVAKKRYFSRASGLTQGLKLNEC